MSQREDMQDMLKKTTPKKLKELISGVTKLKMLGMLTFNDVRQAISDDIDFEQMAPLYKKLATVINDANAKNADAIAALMGVLLITIQECTQIEVFKNQHDMEEALKKAMQTGDKSPLIIQANSIGQKGNA